VRVGAFTPAVAQFSLHEALDRLHNLGVETVELETENYPGDAHWMTSWKRKLRMGMVAEHSTMAE
jgi:hypothetical protein